MFGDNAFEFTEKEDGDEASEWYHSVSGSGISVSSVSDTARRSNVIKCQNDSEAKPVFRIGEKDGTSENPNDSAWDSTKRVVSFWMKGECASMNVQVSASTGAKYVQYLFGTGTNGALSGGNAKVYLGYAAPEDWVRFERNVEADFEAYAGGGATWTNTDGLYIHWPKSLLSYAFYVDDLRLSDSLTVEHNTLGPGVIGHILRHTTWDATTLAKTDRWFHYDQVGSVLNESDANGDDVTRHEQDAFGNVMLTWSGGLWDGGASGWHHGTRAADEATGLHYSFKRWFDSATGSFVSQSPMGVLEERLYTFVDQTPTDAVDPTGLTIMVLGKHDQEIKKCLDTLRCCDKAIEDMLTWLESSPRRHTIRYGPHPQAAAGVIGENFPPTSSNAPPHPTATLVDLGMHPNAKSACATLIHELRHAFDSDRGRSNFTQHTRSPANFNTPNRAEHSAMKVENRARTRCLGLAPAQYDQPLPNGG